MSSQYKKEYYHKVLKADPVRYAALVARTAAYRKANKEHVAMLGKIRREKRSEEKKEQYRATARRWYQSNLERGRAKTKRTYLSRNADPVRREARKQRKRQSYATKLQTDPAYLAKERARKAAYVRERTSIDPNFKIARTSRNLIHQVLRGLCKSKRTMALIGCSVEEFRKHIESQWEPWMNWDNMGRRKDQWSIDHVRPCSSFDLTDPAQQLECFNWKNTMPLSHSENTKKNNWWNGSRWSKGQIVAQL